MKLYAARYQFTTDIKKDYEIVLYKSYKIAEESPHDWFLTFKKYEWKKMGDRIPKKNEIMPINLFVEEESEIKK